MRVRPTRLLNTPDIELWPAWLLRARRNDDARALALADWLLRRKRDGRFLAVAGPTGLRPLSHRPWREAGWSEALACLRKADRPGGSTGRGHLPLARLEHRLHALGLDADAYARRTGLDRVPEPEQLDLAGFDRFGRPLWMVAPAARAWRQMREAAAHEGIALESISGYRSHDYQLGIFDRKRARGLAVDEILTVNAAPGFSEHHSGRALDIGTPGEPPAEETFERTPAFAWLVANAAPFGFVLSYPRDNPHGIVYEPWHWCWEGPAAE